MQRDVGGGGSSHLLLSRRLSLLRFELLLRRARELCALRVLDPRSVRVLDHGRDADHAFDTALLIPP